MSRDNVLENLRSQIMASIAEDQNSSEQTKPRETFDRSNYRRRQRQDLDKPILGSGSASQGQVRKNREHYRDNNRSGQRSQPHVGRMNRYGSSNNRGHDMIGRRTTSRYQQVSPRHGGSLNSREPAYEHITFSKTNCRIILSKVVEDNNSWSTKISELKQHLVTFFTDDTSIKRTNEYPTENRFVIELADMESTTKLYACFSYFVQLVHISSNCEWHRPAGYIEQIDHKNPILRSNAIAYNDDIADVTKLKEKISELGLSNFSLHQIYHQEKYTGSGVITFNDNERHEIPESTNWWYPNKSSISQCTISMNYSNIPNLVQAPLTFKSRIVLLLNCMDPMKLKDDPFVEQLCSILKERIPEAKQIRIVRPSIDYRMTFAHFNEDVGNVYVEFENEELAEKVVGRVSGTKLDGRTLICGYINEQDYVTEGVMEPKGHAIL